jgi:hypothetical protein
MQRLSPASKNKALPTITLPKEVLFYSPDPTHIREVSGPLIFKVHSSNTFFLLPYNFLYLI